jgi:serine/threonine protein kinase/DNA-binding winged helix-turn-helix (wHTH) protein
MGVEPKTSLFRFRFGTAEFDESRFELRVSGLPVDVQRKPLEILSILLAHAGEVVTKEELLEAVWEGRPTVENVLANAVAKLRNALGDENAARIVTLPRVGYRFDGLVERVAVGRASVSRLDLAAGTAVPGRPNFVLERLIAGSPGSEVWLARHVKTRERRVYKFCPDGTRLAALKREATLSRLLHDNLGDRHDFVRVLDWNFETQPFFLECEYGGTDLLQWATQDGHLESLSLAQRIGLFLQIADAVSAAHGVGVLHKDLKPANILVSPEGNGWRVRLTDFGSSRLLEPERLADLGITQLGLTMTQGVLSDTTTGTPLYLAPELIAGAPPTVTSDVYALGVILYQLVIGDLRLPLVPGWDRSVPDDLLRSDIAQATDGDPALRIANVSELASRLRKLEKRREEQQRHEAALRDARIAHEALQRSRARRPWVAAAMAILAIGLGVSLWLYRDARLANARSEAINGFLNWAVLANTGALKTDSDPDPTMRRVLRNAATTVGDVFASDPSSEGWIRLGIGQGLSGLGDYEVAEDQQRQALALLRRVHGFNHERTQVAAYALAMTLLEQSKFIDAEEVLGELDQLTDRSLRNSETIFKSRALRGMLRAARKDCSHALEDLQAAAAIELPESEESAFNLFNVRSWIGETLNCLGRYYESEQLYLSLLGPEDSEKVVGPALVGYARLGYAKALQQRGQPEHAERQLTQALKVLESGVGDADAFTVGQALVEAGSFYAEIGQFDKAADCLTRGRAMLLEIGEQQEKALNALRALGVIDYSRGLWEAAIEKLTAAREGLEAVFGETAPDVQGATYWLAAALSSAGRSDEAAELTSHLEPHALLASLGGSSWAARLEALRGRILLDQGNTEGRAMLTSAIQQLQDDGAPTWLVESLARE